MKATVQLTHSPTTDSILLGQVIGRFEHKGFRGDVVASGRTLRVRIDGVEGYVNINIVNAVTKAFELLTE